MMTTMKRVQLGNGLDIAARYDECNGRDVRIYFAGGEDDLAQITQIDYEGVGKLDPAEIWLRGEHSLRHPKFDQVMAAYTLAGKIADILDADQGQALLVRPDWIEHLFGQLAEAQ